VKEGTSGWGGANRVGRLNAEAMKMPMCAHDKIDGALPGKTCGKVTSAKNKSGAWGTGEKASAGSIQQGG